MTFFPGMEKPGVAGLFREGSAGSGSGDTAAAVHDFGFEFGFEGLNLTKDSKTTGRAAHLMLKLIEDFVQSLGSGPEGWVVLSR